MGCCGFPGGGGGGGAYFPLPPDRVVVTDAGGLPAVGPYWNSFFGRLGIGSAPVVALHVNQSDPGALQLWVNNLSGAINAKTIIQSWIGSTAGTAQAIVVTGNGTHTWARGIWSANGDCVFAYGLDITVAGNQFLRFSRLSSGRQISFFNATPNALVPFRVQLSQPTGTYQYAFELSGGASGVFNYAVSNGGSAEIQVDTDDLSLFSLTTNNHYLRLANNDSGVLIVSSSYGLDVVLNDDGVQGGIFRLVPAVGDPDLIWMENGLFNYRAPYIDRATWPTVIGPVDGFGDFWFQQDATGTVRSVEFQLQIGANLYTASLPLT